MSLARYGRVINKACRGSIGRRISRLSAIERANAPIDVHPEVEDALSSGKPVVSLETAVVTHGLPYPTNLELGLELENIVRSIGSVPATIGMIDGRIKIGLEKAELERLADPERKRVKISRRDIAPAVTLKADGGSCVCEYEMISYALKDINRYHL